MVEQPTTLSSSVNSSLPSGGTNPIFLNEYYRGGEVSTQRTITSYAAMSNSGTGSGTANGIQVAQTSVAGGTVAAGNNDLSTVASGA